MNAYPCKDCGVDTKEVNERYMVKATTWGPVVYRNPARFLCIGCLETRIERKLHRWDFTNCRLNYGGTHKQSDKLQDRLHAEEHHDTHAQRTTA